MPPAKGQRGSGEDTAKRLQPPLCPLVSRWYLQFEPGFNFNAPNHGGGLHAGSRNLLGRSGFRPEGNDWFSAWIDYLPETKRPYAYVYYRGMCQDCADPKGRCWGDHFPAKKDGPCAGKPQHCPGPFPPAFEAGRWYCVEMLLDGGSPHSDGNGADGILDFWIDGLEIGPWKDLWFRNTSDLKINTFWVNLFHHDGKHSDEGILVDDIILATQRIGPIRIPDKKD